MKKRSLLDRATTPDMERRCARKVEQMMQCYKDLGMSYEMAKKKCCRYFLISPQEVEDMMALVQRLAQ